MYVTNPGRLILYLSRYKAHCEEKLNAMVITKFFSHTNYNYSFSHMEERMMRKAFIKLYLPELKGMTGNLKCDIAEHQSINSIIHFYIEDHHVAIKKTCCDKFKKKIIEHLDAEWLKNHLLTMKESFDN